MLKPSYSEIMDVITQENELDNRITSRYMIVIAAAKRARQLTDGANPMIYAPQDRPVSTAIKEMGEGKLSVSININLLEESIERILRQRSVFNSIAAITREDLDEDQKGSFETSDGIHLLADEYEDDFEEEDEDDEDYPPIPIDYDDNEISE